MLDFEWDPAKDLSNQVKHGIAFVDATEVFSDPLSRTIPDPRDFSGLEQRWVTIAWTPDGESS